MTSIDTSFYIVPHADDWQLFMQPNIFLDIHSGKNVIIIIVTAGDAGLGKKYWVARERGCLSSIRFCLAPFKECRERHGKKKILNHLIKKVCINNVHTYFLRVPDGNLDGSGFKVNNYQSLFKLYHHRIKELSKIDNSGSFTSCMEISTLIEAIIYNECKTKQVKINYLNPDILVNINDHNDHICLGNIIQQIPILSKFDQILFQGYCVSKFPVKLESEKMFWKIGMFSAYEKTVYDIMGYSTIKENYQKYLEWCKCTSNFVQIRHVN